MPSMIPTPGLGANALLQPIIAFLGPLGSFSHQAAIECFGLSNNTLKAEVSFNDAFSAVQSQEADYAIIPLENSSNGAVVQTLDLLADRESLYPDITVSAEYYLSVHHCLLMKKAQDGQGNSSETTPEVSKFYSHPQVWGQCTKFLSAYGGVEKQDASSTSKAAEIVSKDNDPKSAAIGSELAGTISGLEVVKANIEDDPSNATRFLVLENLRSNRTQPLKSAGESQACSKPGSKCKSLISFMVDHTSPGALADALHVFKKYGLDLTSINSRPGGVKAWQYVFLVECQRIYGVHDDHVVDKVIHELQKITQTCRNLGSWEDQLMEK
ncbi:P-protein [Nannizzia gypsea CBS 118893]|uniref:prephenate dehydratase n=1 Tax=Arthroderma gypseum (strain ATCC MYA-4604 / CBS 118893) TaxID=535722 RepID=E4UUZ9_ARTGP|nr:P-protein [Nannizzia gypsea CBS 118893]EFR01116.1 P-protein [Nannizzia gypsea CBS 118893]